MSIGVQNDSMDRMIIPTEGLAFGAEQSLELDDDQAQRVLALGAPYKRVALKVARAQDTAASQGTSTEPPHEPQASVEATRPDETAPAQDPAPPPAQEGS